MVEPGPLLCFWPAARLRPFSPILADQTDQAGQCGTLAWVEWAEAVQGRGLAPAAGRERGTLREQSVRSGPASFSTHPLGPYLLDLVARGFQPGDWVG